MYPGDGAICPVCEYQTDNFACPKKDAITDYHDGTAWVACPEPNCLRCHGPAVGDCIECNDPDFYWDPVNTYPMVCTETCGDSKDYQTLECDDGDVVTPNDGCSATCTIEDGWTCTGGDATTPQSDTCTEICGDAFDLPSEGCEDGGTTGGDGCSATCTVETGWSCADDTNINTPDVCTEDCADGLDFAQYPCDDGVPANGDGCDSSCNVEPGWSCSGGTTTSADTCTKICGDIYDLPGECEDGGTADNDGCSSTCTVEVGWTCNPDDGNINTFDVCTEICEDGLDFGSYPCDDGNPGNGDGCDTSCNVEPGWNCVGGTISSPDTCTEICGDGIDLPGEVCEDGNNDNGDGCSSTCTIETGWYCVADDGNPATPDTCVETCGDLMDFGFYDCDDGNSNAGDGCFNCAVEPNYICYGGTPSNPDECSWKHFENTYTGDHSWNEQEAIFLITVNFNATIILPERDAFDLSIEGPLDPYEFEWKLHTDSPPGSAQNYVTFSLNFQ